MPENLFLAGRDDGSQWLRDARLCFALLIPMTMVGGKSRRTPVRTRANGHDSSRAGFRIRSILSIA
jgi:hypothetical protein